jgi:hypothetical protein
LSDTLLKNEILQKENRDYQAKVQDLEAKFRIAEKQWDQLQGEGQRAHLQRQQIENEKEREIEQMMNVIQGLEVKV